MRQLIGIDNPSLTDHGKDDRWTPVGVHRAGRLEVGGGTRIR